MQKIVMAHVPIMLLLALIILMLIFIISIHVEISLALIDFSLCNRNYLKTNSNITTIKNKKFYISRIKIMTKSV